MERFDRAGILPAESQWLMDSPIRYLEDHVQSLLHHGARPLNKQGERVLAEDMKRIEHYLQELMYRMDRGVDSYAYRDFVERTEYLFRSLVNDFQERR